MSHLSRRSVLLGTATVCGLGRLLSAADFWKQKEVANWTEEEIEKFITRSPWAKEANVVGSVESGERQETPRSGGMGRRRGGGGERGSPVMLKGTVRWQSAQIMLAALKTSLPEAFKDHYVIAVSGLPVSASGRRESGSSNTEDRLEDLRNMTTLRTTTQEPAGPDLVQRTKEGAGPFLFGFPKETLTIGAADKEAVFALEAPVFSVRTSFSLKEMIYHGALDV
ncbi:MAG TPA: hypothetical protein VKU01_33620 [Bryobacteraceae bacterium]|nr:hypothetical protein [Bryobacteraceae bacterium]